MLVVLELALILELCIDMTARSCSKFAFFYVNFVLGHMAMWHHSLLFWNVCKLPEESCFEGCISKKIGEFLYMWWISHLVTAIKTFWILRVVELREDMKWLDSIYLHVKCIILPYILLYIPLNKKNKKIRQFISSKCELSVRGELKLFHSVYL